MKLATGTKLTCPSCASVWDGSYVQGVGYQHIGNGERFEIVYGKLFYAECHCGLCMFCGYTEGGWDVRPMMDVRSSKDLN